MRESYLNYHYAYLAPESEWLFITPSLDSHGIRIIAQEAGHFLYDGVQYTERGPLESYQISLFLCDTPGTLRYRGTAYDYCKAKEIMFLDCTQGYRIDTNGQGEGKFIHFWGTDVRYYYDTFARLNNGSPILKRYSLVAEQNLNKLLELYKKPNDYLADLYAETLITEMLLDLIQLALPSTRSVYGEYVQSAIRLINERYRENLTLGLLAEEIHISKYHLSHLFKKETGTTIFNYLQQYRLSKAKELLRSTDLSQESICDRVGIYNCSYLCKLFRIHENTTPDQYRKHWAAHV